MNIKDRLRAARKARGLTQAELAAQLGIKQASVSAWEVGKTEPGNGNLVAIARALNVSTDYLLGHAGGGEPPPDVADAITEIVEELPEMVLDGTPLAQPSQDVAATMLHGTLDAVRASQTRFAGSGGMTGGSDDGN